MRIVGGTHKGRALVAPKSNTTRPTSDRARESLFNILAHSGWAPPLVDARVIDLFAGSGALGLEALSRGAGFGLFIEKDREAARAISANIEALGQDHSARLLRRDVLRIGDLPPAWGGPFSLAFLDPPYNRNLVPPALTALRTGGWLSDDALVVAETGRKEAPDFSGWDVADQRDSGAAALWFLRAGSAV